MNFSFTDEQALLAATAERWAAGVGPTFDPQADVDQLWAHIVEQGWAGLLVPSSLGGSGATLIDACLVVEALARHLVGLPVAGNTIVATSALRLLGGRAGEAHLNRLAEGARRYSVLLGSDLRWPPLGPSLTAWDWRPGDLVIAPDDVGVTVRHDLLAVAANTRDVVYRHGTVVTSLSPTHGPASDAEARFVAAARVGTVATLVGLMQGGLDVAVAHARQREQFGRSIGEFQAVQHLCADMLIDVESARSTLYGAAWAVEHSTPETAEKAAAVAKAWTAPAAQRVLETTIQVLGGIGFTWESPAHRYLRAAHLWAAAFGDERDALTVVADAFFRVEEWDAANAVRHSSSNG